MLKFVLGTAIGITIAATAQTLPALPTMGIANAPDVILCVPPWPVRDAFGVIHNPPK
jgi:hypothetical protein